jgi:hypothetical protein
MDARVRSKDFFTHIVQCKACDVTNNNNGFIDGKRKTRYLSSTKYAEIYEKALTAYHRLQRIKSEVQVDVIMIDNSDDIYANSFLITAQI